MTVAENLGTVVEDNKSLADLMQEAVETSWDLAFETVAPDDHYLDPRDTGLPAEHEDMIWGWADGLMHKYYERMATGRCSLKASLEFDLGEFEQGVRRDLDIMQQILKQVGPPRKLTCAEMQARGYRGAWAGLPD